LGKRDWGGAPAEAQAAAGGQEEALVRLGSNDAGAVAAGLCGILSATQWLSRLGGFRSMARVAAVGGAAG